MNIQSSKYGTQNFKPTGVYSSVPNDKFDYVVCTNKALEPAKLPEYISSAITPGETTVVIIQNGVQAEEPIKEKFPNNPIITCVTWTNAQQPESGLFVHKLDDFIQVGLFPNEGIDAAKQQQSLDLFVKMLKEGGAGYKVEDDILVKRWEKVVWNVAWNSITALTLLDTKSWLDSSDQAMVVSRRVMDEVIEVANAAGIKVKRSLTDELIDKTLGMPGVISSMYTDLRNERPMEVESILGGPVHLGKRLNVSTPTLDILYALIKAQDSRIRKLKI